MRGLFCGLFCKLQLMFESLRTTSLSLSLDEARARTNDAADDNDDRSVLNCTYHVIIVITARCPLQDSLYYTA